MVLNFIHISRTSFVIFLFRARRRQGVFDGFQYDFAAVGRAGYRVDFQRLALDDFARQHFRAAALPVDVFGQIDPDDFMVADGDFHRGFNGKGFETAGIDPVFQLGKIHIVYFCIRQLLQASPQKQFHPWYNQNNAENDGQKNP